MPRSVRGTSPTPSHGTCGAVTLDYSAHGTLHYDRIEPEKASEDGTHHEGSTASEDGRSTIAYSRATRRRELQSISQDATAALAGMNRSVARSRSPSVKSYQSIPGASGRSRHASESPRRNKPKSTSGSEGSGRPRRPPIEIESDTVVRDGPLPAMCARLTRAPR